MIFEFKLFLNFLLLLLHKKGARANSNPMASIAYFDLTGESDEETHAQGNDGTFLRFFACFFVRDVDFATLLNRDDTRDFKRTSPACGFLLLLLLLLLLNTLVF